MKISLEDENLTNYEKEEIEKLLQRSNRSLVNDLDQMWYLMDLVWDDFGCDNKKSDGKNIGAFYSHPVWLLNGLFIEQHPLSMQHRNAISNWIVKNQLHRIVDFGGGFGTLARLIAVKSDKVRVDIYEPHPSDFGLKRAGHFSNIKIISDLDSDYDCLVSTDVLEHVPDPLASLEYMVNSLKTGGYLVIANCFHPVIKCHLPAAFHLRYTFGFFVKLMGLTRVGILEGSHATIYKKTNVTRTNRALIRHVEKMSKLMFPVIEGPHSFIRKIKRLF